jgi:DNA-binding CsgD family transcriptional regulator/tetratricopeptide (TPR) repeat protein
VTFVGRSRELDQLGALLRAETGAVVLISGEPGIGKTRLAREAVAASGMPSCWGRASEDEASPPYWPFRQVIRTLTAEHPPGRLADDLAMVAPEVAPAHPVTLSPEERFRVFEAVSTYLLDAAAGTGLLVVLDDLQWADPPTLRLLVHLAREVHRSRLVVLGTYRDTETHGREALGSALAALASEESVRRVRLAGLTESEVAAVLGPDVPPELAATVSRRSRGNPFFVGELGRLLPSGDGLPDAVRDAVRARLRGLSASCRTVITAGAVLGTDLDPVLLAAILDHPVNDVLGALDEATRAGVVSISDGWHFDHDLIRDAARLDLPTTQRLATHAKIASCLEGRTDATDRAAELAHHWLESLPYGEPAKAVEWAERAAAIAMTQLAWENAADLYSRALRASPGLTDGVRAKLLRGKGIAHLRGLDVESAVASLRLSADAARTAGDALGMADTALAMEGISDPSWAATGRVLCVEALAALPDGDSPVRARLLAQYAAEGTFDDAPDMDEFSEQAFAMAERTGDARAVRSALRARQIVRAGPDGVHDRLALGDRLLRLGIAAGDDDGVLWGRLWRFDALCQLGRIDHAEAELPPMGVAATRLRRPMTSWQHLRAETSIAHGRGRFAQARELALQAIDLVDASGSEPLVALSVWMLAAISGMTGQPDELAHAIEALKRTPGFTNAPIAAWHADLGRLDEARRGYRPEEVRGRIPRMRLLPTLAALARLAAVFDDPPTAEAAYRRLLPHAELIVCGGAGVNTVLGSTHGALGLAAAATGRLDDAVRHLRRAVEINDRSGLVPFVAITRLDLAKILLRRRRPGDRDESAALATSAASIADRLGMTLVQRAARDLTGRTPGPLTKREIEIAALVAQGLTNKQIAAATHISERTAENHVQHILAKLGFATRAQIAAWAVLQP